MKIAKRLTVLMLVFLMIFSISGCIGLKVVKEIATVDGNLISKGEFMYYLESAKAEMLQKAGITAETDEAKAFWETEADGKTQADIAKEKALDDVIRVELACILAADAGLSVDSETKSSIKASVTSKDSQQKAQVDALKGSTGLSDDMLITLLEKSALSSQYAQFLTTTEPDAVTPTEEAISEKYQSDYVRVKHILISNTPTEDTAAEGTEAVPAEDGAAAEDTEAEVATPAPTEDPEVYKANQKLLAAEVLEKAKAGSNFEALITEYGEDPGAESSPDGYTFAQDGSMVKEFQDAAFALEVGAISDLVETTYGWHIIKRYELLTDGEEYSQYIQTVTSALSQDMFNAYVDAKAADHDVKIRQSTVDGIKIK